MPPFRTGMFGLLLLTGCSLPSMYGGMPPPTPHVWYSSPGPQPASANALQNLVAQSFSQDVGTNLATPVTLAFPLRLGVLMYAYTPVAQPEDQQAIVKQLDADLRATQLVRGVTLIPGSLVNPGDSPETLRKIASRFQLDTLLILGGSSRYEASTVQGRGFFDAFSNQRNFDARTQIDALVMNVQTGQFLSPIEVLAKEGPAPQNPDDANYGANAYAQREKAETAAFQALDAQVIAAIRALAGPSTPAADPSSAPASAAPARP